MMHTEHPYTFLKESSMFTILETGALQSWRKWIAVLAALLVLGALAHPRAHAAAPVAAKTFASAEEAAKELMAAVKANNTKELMVILGPDSKSILESGDAVADKEGRARFAQFYDQANKLEKSADGNVVLNIGKDAWPFPIPIVKDAAGWRFDTKAGREEILNRRIGRNELFTMQSMKAYVDAQREYYLANPQKDKLFSYAQRFGSTEGKRDGLYYRTKAGEPPSPLGPLFDAATAAGYAKAAGTTQPPPYHGYHYRILKGQGADAPGGAYDYVVQGRMIGGHAVVAWPATYGNSGVMTFLVNHDGVVYEKDLGPETAAIVSKITRFNPDKSWSKAK
jgi:hypothetical protein